MFITIVAFVFVLSLLILVHEIGHFAAARRVGIRVEEFGIGWPPRLFSRRIGETLYSINLLPLGGFVRMFGEFGERGARQFHEQAAGRASGGDLGGRRYELPDRAGAFHLCFYAWGAGIYRSHFRAGSGSGKPSRCRWG